MSQLNGYYINGIHGHTGRKLTEETKKKISIGNTGKKLTEETKRKMSAAQKGKPRGNHTEETKEKISIGCQGERSGYFVGYFITPFGKFASTRDAVLATDGLISNSSFYKWCKTNNIKLISKQAIGKSNYLMPSMLGKTYKEIGFGFEPS